MSRVLPLLFLAGCTPTTFVFTPTMTQIHKKPGNCPVEVLTSEPTRGFQEVGTLQLYNGDAPKSLDDFKKAVAKQVCEEGGDAAIAIADDHGKYTKGTIVAYTTDSGAPIKAGSPAPQQGDNELPK
jgi:hypothetical protein